MGCYFKNDKARTEMEFGRVVRRGGSPLFMCGMDAEMPHCFSCAWVADYFCDYPVGDDKTCDRPMCQDHRHSVSPEIDYCGTHYPEWCKYRDSGAVLKHFERVIPFRTEKSPATS
jgi:hypothetical protein